MLTVPTMLQMMLLMAMTPPALAVEFLRAASGFQLQPAELQLQPVDFQLQTVDFRLQLVGFQLQIAGLQRQRRPVRLDK